MRTSKTEHAAVQRQLRCAANVIERAATARNRAKRLGMPWKPSKGVIDAVRLIGQIASCYPLPITKHGWELILDLSLKSMCGPADD